MDAAQITTVSDGRVFSGRQSVPLKLVDELGSERQAIAWLESARKVPKNLPVTDWKPASGQGFGLFSALGLGADLLGLDGLSARLAEAGAVTRGGMLVLWRPSPSAAP